MARAILEDLSDGLNIRALEVHRRRSTDSGQVAFGASGELKSSRCITDTREGRGDQQVRTRKKKRTKKAAHLA